MRSPRLITALTLAAGLGLAACGTSQDEPAGPAAPSAEATPQDPAEDDADPSTQPSPETITPTPLPDAGSPSEEPAMDAGLQDLPLDGIPEEVAGQSRVQEAAADAMRRAGLETGGDLPPAGWFEVTWSDGSLGCPEPGMQYTQALVPGHQLVFEVDGQRLSYHAGADTPFTYCANPVAPSERTAGGAADPGT